MMKDLKDEWDTLFVLRITELKKIKGNAATLTAINVTMIGQRTLVSERKTIIEDIILWCDDKDLTLIYFSCICEVFKIESQS